MKRITSLLGTLFILLHTVNAQTLEECQQAAERNYPLIRQYDLIEKTSSITVSNISKGWLPQISASAQATYQSDVAAWPDGMKDMMQQMGLNMKGLSKGQYRVGIDINQTIFDGGTIKSQKDIAREQEKVQKAENEVNLYSIRKRVNELYFALLMTKEQIQLNKDLQELLNGNEKKLASMVKSGTAAQSDLNSVKAERLNAIQQLTTLESQQRMLQAVLSTFCGIDVKEVQKPSANIPSNELGKRPELTAIDARLRLLNAQEKALNSALMPKLSAFAQGFYGYPGYNMFEDMMNRNGSFNGMVGARLTWNIGALYTRKNDKMKIQLQRDMAENNRDVFLFNNRLEQIQQNENMNRYRKLMAVKTRARHHRRERPCP